MEAYVTEYDLSNGAEFTIDLRFYQKRVKIPAFRTIEEALNAEPVSDYGGYGRQKNGFAVAFELDGLYAVYVHHEDRYYSSFIPDNAKVRYTGWYMPGKPIEWERQTNNLSRGEQDTLRALGFGRLVAFEEND